VQQCTALYAFIPIYIKHLTKAERACSWVLSQSIFDVRTVNFPHKP